MSYVTTCRVQGCDEILYFDEKPDDNIPCICWGCQQKAKDFARRRKIVSKRLERKVYK
jgi:hypothetical protein